MPEAGELVRLGGILRDVADKDHERFYRFECFPRHPNYPSVVSIWCTPAFCNLLITCIVLYRSGC